MNRIVLLYDIQRPQNIRKISGVLIVEAQHTDKQHCSSMAMML